MLRDFPSADDVLFEKHRLSLIFFLKLVSHLIFLNPRCLGELGTWKMNVFYNLLPFLLPFSSPGKDGMDLLENPDGM